MPAGKWVLTTCVKTSPDYYTDNILPVTGPLFSAYATRWGMDYDPHVVTDEDIAEFVGHIPTRGTEPVYASFPHRRRLLDAYDGVLYMDEDAVILNGERDICREVTDRQPIGMVYNLTGALQVLRSTPKSKEFLDMVWDMRHAFRDSQWAEEGAMKYLMGWEHVYRGKGHESEQLHETEWTPELVILEYGCKHPEYPNHRVRGPWFAMNPGGVWPLEKRLSYVKEYAAKSTLGG